MRSVGLARPSVAPVIPKLGLALTQLIKIALRNVLRQRRRSGVAIVAIAFGVIAMMLATGFIEWIFWATREGTAVTQLGHIQVTRPGYHRQGQADLYTYLVPVKPPGLEAIERDPRVRAVVPRLSLNGLISHDDSTLTFIAMGVDPARDPSLRYLIIPEGDRLIPGDSEGILIGTGLAANLASASTTGWSCWRIRLAAVSMRSRHGYRAWPLLP